ncbi:BZ3500_MvSof-1268-A1-R1_Chr4-3g07261 [Microbotryum saponariae]|uniref:BZ3500_MvSof-1268-A1-R1_Chr4-3g07261 protein n=1 Tax=Microbotryum saponariae TaxID=289078 RepID=A0A2X0KZY0_9BASI|nr:BZ3500_MvSof-1268-A1-R1_Chr4-3g07261 [Microbotryum saponariae]SDA06924.1 BZ3501_MvSof-1269-A2-R1_Chr4-2g06970 [Microbotryum saponariae]
MSPSNHLAALEEATETVSYKIYLSNTLSSYEEWLIWISNNLRLDDLLDVTTLGIPAILEDFQAGMLTPPAASQPSTSGDEENTSPSASAAPTPSAADAEAIRLRALVLKGINAKASRLISPPRRRMDIHHTLDLKTRNALMIVMRPNRAMNTTAAAAKEKSGLESEGVAIAGSAEAILAR